MSRTHEANPGGGDRAEAAADGIRSRLPTWVAIVLGAALVALAFTRLVPPARSVDEVATDLLVERFAPREPQHDGIVLVTLGEDTVESLACRSPIDRAFVAGLVERLQDAGVRAIGLDLMFDQPTLPNRDERLRRAIAGARVPVVATTALDHTPLTERQRAHLAAFLEGVSTGHANLAKDTVDGTVRWHVPAGPDGTPSFPARLAREVGREAPTEPFRIAWRRGPDENRPPIPTYPAEAIGLVPEAWLAGRIALVGTTLVGVDHHRTPLSHEGRDTPGVEIQGHVLAQILDGRANPRLSAGGEAPVVVALGAAGALLGASGLALWLLVAASGACLLALWAGCAGLLAAGGPLVPPVAPSLAMALALGTTVAHASLRNRAERQAVMQLFAKHVSQPIAEEIWRRRDVFMSGGRPRPQLLTATVLFSDVEGFTTVCERLEPEPLIRWLEGYLDVMVRVVAQHDGIVLRFVGDAILAVFGVPVPRTTQEEIDADARRAVRCALRMAEELEALNARWREEGLPPVGMRVGIHTGPVVAGSLGGMRHMEYSLLGDTANTAARLEALAKTAATPGRRSCRILVGEATWHAVRGEVLGIQVGEMALKGKDKTVRVWQVDGDQALEAWRDHAIRNC